jgi:Uma2 family endonuclease
MTALAEPTPSGFQPVVETPFLESGDHLTASEFLRRYDAMPEVKKAELIDGIVYMASPVRVDQHGEPDSLSQGLLLNYAAATPGVRSATNATVRLGPDDVPQPDVLLRILPSHGGRTRVNARGYLVGAPELVMEIAASSASVDTREKLHSYRRAGVQEYIIWRTQQQALDWWTLHEDDYVPLEPDAHGIIRSKVFPGLWLDVGAMLRLDATIMLARLAEGLATVEHTHFVKALGEVAAQQSEG